MGSQRECTRILGLDGYRVERLGWEADGSRTRVRVSIERRGIRGYECSGCRRRTWRVRDAKARTWDDLPWAVHPVTLVYSQRRVWCRTCGIRTERLAFAEGHARITRRLRQVIGLDCQSMPTSHAAVRQGGSWSQARRAERAVIDALADLRVHDLNDGADERAGGVILAAIAPGVAHVLDLRFVEMAQLVLFGLRAEAQLIDVVDDLAQVVAA